MKPLLKLERINKSFGGLTAVADFSLELNDQDVRGIIGPNGAGKTTVFNLINSRSFGNNIRE